MTLKDSGVQMSKRLFNFDVFKFANSKVWNVYLFWFLQY